MATSHRISTIGSRGGRPLVDDALRLRVCDLRRPGFGWVAPDLKTPDGTTIRLRIEVAGDTAVWLHLAHWPRGAAWASSSYTVALVPRPQHLGGSRWLFRDPDGFGLCSTLYLPSSASCFGTRQAHGLAFASQRQRAPARAAARAQRIRADLGGDVVMRPKGQHAATFARRLALLAELDGTRAR